MRNSSNGQMIMLGTMMKVWLSSMPPDHFIINGGYAIPWAVLQWVSIYWFSRAGPAASVRIYYEATVNRNLEDLPFTSLPYGISYFPKEVIHIPRTSVLLYLPSFVLANQLTYSFVDSIFLDGRRPLVTLCSNLNTRAVDTSLHTRNLKR